MNKKRILFLIAMCILTVSGFKAGAQEAMTKMKKTYPVAMQEYGKKMSELKTDYIIVIDVSATMDRYKYEVVPALTRFFDSIDYGNYVRIITFGTLAKEEQTRLEINKQTRPQIVKTLNYAYDVVTKDNGMRGYTDFVLMGNKIVDLIKNDADSDIHFIVVFSDLKDDWKKGVAHRPQKEWSELGQQFKSLNVPVNTLSTYFPHDVKDEAQIVQSIELISGAFPNFDYSSDINEVLGGKLEESKFIIYTEKLKQLIVSDVNEIGKKELFASQIEKDKSVMLNLNMDNEELQVKKYVRGIVIDTCIMGEKSNDILDVEFDNHREIAKRGGSKSIGKVVFDKGGLWTKDCFAEYVMQYHFLFQQGKDENAQSFTKDMEALELLDKLPQKANFHADGKYVFLWPFWLIVVLGILALVFLFFLFKNTIIPARIKSKQLYCRDVLNVNQKFDASDKRKFIIGNPQKCDQKDWKLQNAGFVVRVKAVNGGPFNWLIKKKIVFNLEKQDDVTMYQKGKQQTKANILKGEITVNEGFGKTYKFTIVDLLTKRN